MAHPINEAMDTRPMTVAALNGQVQFTTPEAGARIWATLALLTVWHMHGAQRHIAAERRAQGVARVRAALATDEAARATARALDRGVAK